MKARVARASVAALTLALLAAPTQGRAAVQQDSDGWHETGTASWYGPRFQGRRTSSGVRFDDRRLTAAHPSLPLGSRVRVTRPDTGASVVVTINDRQPEHGDRVIDLSRAAAQRLGMIAQGTAEIRLTLATGEPGANATASSDVPDDEVAEAPDAPRLAAVALSPSRRGQPRTRRAAPSASVARGCCHAPSAVPARS